MVCLQNSIDRLFIIPYRMWGGVKPLQRHSYLKVVATVNSRCRRKKKSAFNQSENSTAAIGCCILGGQGYALPTHHPPFPIMDPRTRVYHIQVPRTCTSRTCAFLPVHARLSRTYSTYMAVA